jgi:PleD family two-component response regulator
MMDYRNKQIRSVLCVDDDEDDASLLESAVQSVNDEIQFVKMFGGEEALDYLKETSLLPDLILMDCNMPVMNGFECLEEIKRIRKFSSIPIVMISTSASPKDIALAMDLGATKFFTKPNTYVQLCNLVKLIFEEVLEAQMK